MGNLTREQIKKALYEFDDHLTDGAVTNLSKGDPRTDYTGLHDFIMSKYNGDGSKLTKEERNKFFIREKS